MLVFFKESKIFILVNLIFFLLVVSFKLNGSSLAIWNKYLPSIDSTDGVIFGTPLGIRSDEWLVSTPLLLSQASKKFIVENRSIGVGKSTLVAHYQFPVYHYSNIFKPQNIGFFLFDIERGLSFLWGYKIFGLIVSTFILLLIFSYNNFWISASLSVIFYLSSYIQWWFSVPVPEILVAVNSVVISFYFFIKSNSFTKMMFYACGVVYFFINFTLMFYPPSQIVLGYFGLLCAFLILKESLKENIKLQKFKIIISLISTCFLVLFFYKFYAEIKPVLDVILNTVYPGQRSVPGGNMPFYRFFSGFYDIFYTEGKFPRVFGNVCEASNFIYLFPIVSLFSFFKQVEKKNRLVYELLPFLSFFLFLSIWFFFGFPSFISKALLLNKVPVNRAFIGLGLVNIVGLARLLSYMDKNVFNSKLSKSTFLIGFICFISFGLYMRNIDTFYSFGKIFGTALLFGGLILLLTSFRLKWGILLLFLLSLKSLTVNPISQGFSWYFKKKISKYITRLDDKNSLWLVSGNFVIPMYLKSLGFNVIGGISYIPDFQLMNILDPDQEAVSIYNRHAHSTFFLDFSLTKAKFSLLAPDSFAVYINPCSLKLREIGISYIVAPAYEDHLKMVRCGFERLNTESLNGFDIYKLKK